MVKPKGPITYKKNKKNVDVSNFDELDAEALIDKYKWHALLGVLVIVGLIVGGTYMIKANEDKQLASANEIFNFKESDFKSFLDKKLSSQDLVKNFEMLRDKLGLNENVALLSIQIGQELRKEAKLSEAISLLGPSYEKYKTSELMGNFLGNQLSGLYEDNKKPAEAAAILEEVLKNKAKLLLPKIYLDLGRLYIELGNSVKARTNLEYLIENYKKDELVPIARVFLSKIK